MQNHFALFDLAPSYALDLDALHKAYVAIQRKVHPDRLIGKSEAERATLIIHSMDANDAYEALKSPLSRAEHLLALRGIIVNTDEHDTHKPSQDVLMEMLEQRESMSQLSSEVEVAQQVHALQQSLGQTEKELTALFETNRLDAAAQASIRLRYLGKALEEALSIQYRFKSHS